MLKVLLYMYASIIAIASYAQPSVPEWTGPAEMVIEDPNRNIADFSSSNESGKLHLTWRVAGETPAFFTIERSDNGKNFEVLAVLNNIRTQRNYQWIDDAPRKGKSYYRLKYSYNEGETLYSKTVAVSIAGNITYKFYPNPVDHILIIRSESNIDVQISDANGRIRINQPNIQGLHTINVSSLEKGIYLIRFSNKLTAVMSQEKLIKK